MLRYVAIVWLNWLGLETMRNFEILAIAGPNGAERALFTVNFSRLHYKYKQSNVKAKQLRANITKLPEIASHIYFRLIRKNNLQ